MNDLTQRLLKLPAHERALLAERLASHENQPEPAITGLAAYVVARDGTTVTEQELRSYLGDRVPGYMVPQEFVLLDELPRLPSGKIDQSRLPEKQRTSPLSAERPLSATEEILAGIWCELLGVDSVSPGSNFFELGGHSLLATRVMARVRKLLGVDVPLRAIFETSSLAGLAAQIEEFRNGGGTPLPAINPRRRDDAPVLSVGQVHLCVAETVDTGAPSYNMPGALRLRGRLDRTALEQALQRIVDRHEVLRSAVVNLGDGEPALRLVQELPVVIPLEDLRELRDEAQAQLVMTRARELANEPFRLSEAPLFRLRLLRVADDEYVFLYNLHHVIADGWSFGIFLRELVAFYNAGPDSTSSLLPPLRVQYPDFAVWERNRLAAEQLQASRDFWVAQLSGAPRELLLPTDWPRPSIQASDGAGHPIAISRELTDGLKAIARKQGATLYMTLLAAYYVLLQRYSGQSELVVGSPISGRVLAETEDLIGLFANMLPLRADLSKEPSFRQLLTAVRETCLAAYAHQALPFERIVEAIDQPRDPGRHPVFQATLTLQNTPMPSASLVDVDVEAFNIPPSVSPFDLSLYLSESDAGLSGYLVFRTDLFEAGTIARMADHFTGLLSSVVAAPSTTVGKLALHGPGSRVAPVVAPVAPTRGALASERCLHELFEVQAAATPQAIAVSWGSERVSYQELDRRANRLARHLIELGVSSQQLVGIQMERSIELIVAILAVLKAGAAYLPLDPLYPESRRNYMLDDARASVVLTDDGGATSEQLGGRRTVDLKRDASVLVAYSGDNLGRRVDSSSLAYVIYTSGSTGNPKGVLVEHRNVTRLFAVADGLFSFGADDVWTLFHSYAFDFSVWEIWGALLNGGRLVIVPGMVTRSPKEFCELLVAEQVTVLNQTPSAFRALTDVVTSSDDVPHALRWVIFGGEALDLGALAPWIERFGDQRPKLVNMYGITETTVHVTIRVLTADDIGRPRGSMIGRPLPDLTIRLLDQYGQEVPAGIPGEIYVGGAGVARGYLDRPELTAARFVPDPDAPDTCLYRTGDLARWREPGELQFLGRIDQQVKIRGYRIELGEIEAALQGHASVTQAVVLMDEQPGKDARLVAYWVGEDEPVGSLRAYLDERLPFYMVPSAFLRLPALPLTPEGKMDRRSLALLSATTRETTRDYQAPQTEYERLIADIWQDLLGVERVGASDNFFQLGGHSLLALKTIARVRTKCQRELSVKDIFAGQTVAAIARRLEELPVLAAPAHDASLPAATDDDELVLYGLPVRRLPDQDYYELSPYQLPEWYMQQLEPDNPFYNVSNSDEILTGDLDIDVFVRAWQALIERHDAFQTYFDTVDGRPVQRLSPPVRLVKEEIYVDCTAVPEDEVDRTMRRLIDVHSCTIFDFTKAPLLVLKLVEFPGKRFLLIFATHHIIWDEICTMSLAGELSEFYNAFRSGRAPELPPLPCRYVDFADWVNRAVASGALDHQRRYWLEKFRVAPPVLELPTDFPRPQFQTFNGATVNQIIPPALHVRMTEFLREQNTTLYIFLLSVLNLHLYRITGQRDFVVGTPIANRGDERLENIIGVFATALPMRCEIAESMTFGQLLTASKQVAVEAYDNHTYPSILAIQEINPTVDFSRARLFSVMYGVQNDKTQLMRTLKFDDLNLTFLHGAPTPEFDRAKFDFSLVVDTFEDQVNIQWTHNTDLFRTSTVEHMLGQLMGLIEQVIEQPDRALTDYRLLSLEQERALLAGLGGVAGPYRDDLCVHQTFQQTANAQPEAVALIHGERRFTYGELERKANQLANSLIAGGLQREERVAVTLSPSFEQVAAVLGVLKAGGAYVPVGPDLPDARRQSILGQAGARVTIDDAYLASAPVQTADTAPPAPRANPGSLAYVLFTSGTTGTPKGIEIEHRGVLNLLDSTQLDYALGKQDKLLFLTPLGFDASVLDIFWPLSVGAAIVVADGDDRANPQRIAALIATHGVTVMQTVPLMLDALVDTWSANPPAGGCSLRLMICGGAYLTRRQRDRFLETVSVKLVNHYGPTEVTVDATRFDCSREFDGDVVSIGRPIRNARVYVLDARQRLLPPNVVGEIYVASPGLARGYVGDAALTARRFVEVALPGEPAQRMYRTGDLGRLSASGDLYFVGRVDKQVKIRGNRVELEEIETVLADHPDVQRNVVTLQRSDSGVEQLVAHVELRQGASLLDQKRSLYLYTLAQRPELARDLDTLHTGAWPEYFLYDDHVRHYWARLSEMFAEYQLALVDRDNVAVAAGNAVPIAWNGDVADLPQGWDDGVRRAFDLREAGGKPDTLLILAAVIADEHQETGLSTLVLEAFKRLGAAHGLKNVVVPVRPTGALTRPDLTFGDWCALRREDGMPADHWLRSHERVGGRVLRVSHESQRIVAPVEAWERWAGQTFPASGSYRVPGALQPVYIDLEEGVGRYYDPSVWMQHFYDGDYTWRPTDARALRTFVQDHLPPYMVPEHVRFIPEMPLAESGKIDERRLPVITLGNIEDRPKIAPQTDVQRTLVRIWAEVLGLDEVGVLDDFYELGGHSIAAVRTLVKLEEELGVSIRLRDFFRERTIMGISRLIENQAP